MSQVINANQNDFESVVIKSAIPVLVDFWAPWCGPCRAMAPILDEVSDELAGKLKIVKVDIDNPDNQNLGSQYEVRSIPNMKLFKDGKIVHELVGMMPKPSLIAEVTPLI